MGPSAEARPDVVMKTPPTVRREAAAPGNGRSDYQDWPASFGAPSPLSIPTRGRGMKAIPAPQTTRAMMRACIPDRAIVLKAAIARPRVEDKITTWL